MRILLAEDEEGIAQRVAKALRGAGYLVEQTDDGEDAWFRGDTEDFDAVVLDLGLPQMDGLQILKKWRAAGRDMPVLVLTARGAWTERVEGIDAGADDYLPKPFQMEELKARLRALIRRSGGAATPVISAGGVDLDTRHMSVAVHCEPVQVSPLEFRLLNYLMHNRGRVLSQLDLTIHVYGDDIERESNAIEVLIARLRKKLPKGFVQTRRGYGYTVPAEPDRSHEDE